MTPEVEKIFEAALALPPDLRETLAEKLLDSLDLPSQEDVDAAWLDEIQRRLDALEKGEIGGTPVEEVIRKLKARRR